MSKSPVIKSIIKTDRIMQIYTESVSNPTLTRIFQNSLTEFISGGDNCICSFELVVILIGYCLKLVDRHQL